MAQLVLKGHTTRGMEVIQLLVMLGANNQYTGTFKGFCYWIEDGQVTSSDVLPKDSIIFSLEEFEEKYPYKIGDRVTYKCNHLLETQLITNMCWDSDYDCVLYYLDDCNIIKVDDILYRIGCPEDNIPATEEKPDIGLAPDLKGEDYSGRRFGYKIPNGYEFECVRKNEIILKPIKPQYPKTYKECCDVLGLNTMDNDAQGYKADLIIRFQELIIARDAYWKIAGEQMGLGKPWEPDWKDDSDKYFICYIKDEMWKSNIRECNRFLVFPTAEMQDAFYENFKKEIEQCKELL